MENKKLTKELLDKVRHIEGFPKGKDEDIIKLSDPPYYTACSNPFIQDFIDAHGTPYDEETDDYHREPFSSDVSEGKNDLIYNAHSYHTKVPYKAIMRYILHYTEPGDIVFDGFCGTGMTGVAAQMCENPDPKFKMKIEEEIERVKWGARKAVLGDLSPVATFISHNYNKPVDVERYKHEAKKILEEVEKECGWMYETYHVRNGEIQKDITGKPVKGKINYTVWSDVFVCPQCSVELVFSEIALDKEKGRVKKELDCSNCHSKFKKRDLQRAWISRYDKEIDETIRQAKQVPFLINYSVGKKSFYKSVDDFDEKLIRTIEKAEIPYWFPTKRMPKGDETRRNDRLGLTHVHHFYSKRALYTLSKTFHMLKKRGNPELYFTFQQAVLGMSKIARYVPTHYSQVNQYLSGTLYIGSQIVDVSIDYILRNKIQRLFKVFYELEKFNKDNAIIETSSCTNSNAPSRSIDYIFTDPPFGDNLMYSELNFFWEVWLGVLTNNELEAVVNKAQKKGLYEYQLLMEKCFNEINRVLKPGRWFTMVFHNSKNRVWNAIQEALGEAGFIIADVRLLDKQQGSFKQVTTTTAVKKDLIVSAYKPKEGFIREFSRKAGSEEGVWEFVSQHLGKLPVVVEQDGKLNFVAERQNYLLYDRMVAFHIQNGYSIPMGAAEFYDGLENKFPERDGMYFLPDQVTDYDKKRMQAKEIGQLSLFIMDEKSAIQWLRSKLEKKSLTYQEIQPDFMREASFFRHEKGLELQEILNQNFLQDEKGRWYVPDPNKQADLEKLRERALLQEFDEYKENKGKLKKFRTEAVRAGFKHCWSNGDYKTIIKIAKKIPESVLQEDLSLLMYYNNALTREGQK